MRRRGSIGLRALALVALVGWPRKEYPDAIATALEGQRPAHTPPCSVCHLDGKTSGATVFTPFAWAMRLRGLGGTRASATTAVLKVQADHVDSDGDGVDDADEIIAGTDPNNAGVATDLEDPHLGCQLGGRAPAGSPGAVVAIAALALIRRRARNRARPERRRTRAGWCRTS
jgi:thrombospondin type 3 repeat protein